VAIGIERWQFFLSTVGEHREFRVTMLPLEDAEASAQCGTRSIHVVGTALQLARQSTRGKLSRGLPHPIADAIPALVYANLHSDHSALLQTAKTITATALVQIGCQPREACWRTESPVNQAKTSDIWFCTSLVDGLARTLFLP
jgi:hypothetical protein